MKPFERPHRHAAKMAVWTADYTIDEIAAEIADAILGGPLTHCPPPRAPDVPYPGSTVPLDVSGGS